MKQTFNLGEFYFEVEDGTVRLWRHGAYPQRTPNTAPIPCCTPCSRVPVAVLFELVRLIRLGVDVGGSETDRSVSAMPGGSGVAGASEDLPPADQGPAEATP